MRVALVTSISNPLIEGEILLLDELVLAGFDVQEAAWDDSSIDWQKYDAAILRTTWNYVDNCSRFMRWLNRTSQLTMIYNSPQLVSWNIDKRYLFDLERQGIRIVPTINVNNRKSYNKAKEKYGNNPVIKPYIGNSARGIARILPESFSKGEPYLVQPYITEVTKGVVSAVFFNNQLSHSIISIPPKNEYRTQPKYGTKDDIYSLSKAELAFCQNVLATLSDIPLYARVDFMTDSRGALLLELELVEPYLFFEFSNSSAEKFVNEFRKLL